MLPPSMWGGGGRVPYTCVYQYSAEMYKEDLEMHKYATMKSCGFLRFSNQTIEDKHMGRGWRVPYTCVYQYSAEMCKEDLENAQICNY